MSDVLERIRRELEQRLESTRAAAQEHERVRAALEALERAVAPVEKVARRAAGGASPATRGSAGGGRSVGALDDSAASGSASSPAPEAVRVSGSRTSTARGRKAAASTAKARRAAKSGGRARSSTKKPARARAPRGANRETVIAVVRERPGVSAGELAVASGIRSGTLYSLLARMTAGGELAKRELPGGRTGYALASSDAPVSAAADGPTIHEDRSLAHTEDARTAQDRPSADRP